MRRIRPSTVTASVVAAALLSGSVAAYAMSPGSPGAHKKTVHVWVTPGTGAVDKILITGGIGDYGKAISTTKDGTVSTHGHYVKIKLQHGTFEVNAVALNHNAQQAKPTISHATCSAFVIVHGPVTLSNGTGKYAGISGSVRLTLSYAFLAHRYHSGKHKGSCNFDSEKPKATFGSTLSGVGSVTL